MKKLYKLIAVLFFLIATTNIFSQSAYVKWPLTSDQNPNIPIGNIQALSQSIGTPISPYKLEMYPQQPYASNGQQLWTGNQGTGWIAGSPDYTRYIQFDVSPTSGNDFTVQNVSFQYGDFPTPNNTDYHILKSEVWYSTDNWNSQGQVQLNSSPLDYLSTAIQTFSANLNVLVQNGQTFSLRIYPYAPNGAIAMIPSFATHRNVIIEGTTSPVVSTGSICGMKFNDRNGDGIKNGDDEGLQGWTINLSMGAVQMTATTGADGSYCFNNLAAGTYTLSETLQSGWRQTYPDSSGTQSVTLTSGQSVVNIDFGNKRIHGFLAGYKFNDINGSGDQQLPDETGLANWTIILSGPVSDTTFTDATGYYIINNLPAGTYTITEENQLGWQATYPSSGSYTVILSEGVGAVRDFGNRQVGSICGMKFNDLNGNGEKDEGEEGISGWTINLSMGAVNMTATTGEDGSYCFNDLPAGTYTLSETPQDGWEQTYPTNPSTHIVVLPAGQNILNVDFGNMQYGSVGGMKFNDIDGDGEKDEGEPGISGWIIALTVGASPGGDGVSITTDENGEFHFDNVPPGVYTLQELQQDGWEQTYPDSSGTYILTITSGLNLSGKDFGNKQLFGSICGMKFNDLNGDGRKGVDEPGLAGWTINLSMGAVNMTTTTGADGSYCFNNLPAGTYTLSETPQDGWEQTYPTNPSTHTVVLPAGQNILNKDFGNKQLFGSVCGMKFNDLNGNRINDNEPGLSGWVIELKFNGPNGEVTLRDTTDSNGGYCFNNLPFGNYMITEVNKSPWTQTAPASGSYNVTINQEVNLIGYDFGNKEVLNPDCTDFENSSLSGWQGNNTSVSIQQNGDNHFIQTTDQSGPSSFFNSSKPLIGNWTNLFANGCGSLCFDVTFLYGGNPYNGVNPPQTFVPYIVIQGSGFSAAFITNNPISVGDGWHSYCAPLSFLNSDGTLPSNSDGHWVMSVGTANDWNTLLSNVTSVRLPVDPTSYQNEKFGFDNICLNNTGDCDPPLRLGSICGLKILDKDGDGERDSNEDIIPNWGITLTDGVSFYNAVTDENGEYCFNDLPAGTYTISEEHRTGWKQIFPADPGVHTITLLPGENKTDINFSNIEDITIQLGSICGTKFNDINGDGDQDLPNEVALPGWTFQLTGASNQTVITDLNGNFCFTNLRAGNYIISEVIQDGWEPTAPDTTGIVNVTLLEGENFEGIFFGNKEIFGSICGMKYNDLNDDGNWDIGEPGLPNWQITLSSMGYTSSGHFSGPTLDLVGTATTDENGIYCFTNVRQGNYLIGETAQNGWTQTEPSSFIYGITLAPAQNIEGLNFGNKEDSSVVLGSICGIKFNDKDGDGLQDDGELGIPDWQIQIGGPVDMTVVTDKEGKFCFENLPPGEYKVGEEFRSGWRQTKPSTNFYIIQLASGEGIEDLQFGNTEDDSVQLGSICGTKFNDKNRDGRKVDGELGIANWTIYLEGPTNLTALTDDNGNFCFYGLIPGKYTVREENKTGWRQTKPSSITYTLEVGNGDNFTGIDFGNFEDPTVTLGSICGMKFNDLNMDGRKQDNEPGIANWTINLSGTMNLTTQTDARGKFCFENLKFGNYTISEAHKDGWKQTAPSTGSYTFELSEDNSSPDTFYFGNKEDATVQLGSICGLKFFDKDGDGTKGLTEPGISDWQINISGPVDRSLTTDKNGEFCFDDLPPGTYIIKEEPQTDWIQTYPSSPDHYTVLLTSGQNLIGYYFGNKYEPKVGCVDPPGGMVAWWSLDLSSRDARQDLAGFNNFGTMVNGPLQVAGKVLGALQFDGVDDYVEVADHFALNFGTGDFSFDAWIQTTDIRIMGHMIVDKRISATSFVGYAFYLNEGKLSLLMADGLFTSYVSPVFVADGSWHHIAVTVSRTNTQGIIFYLDGVPTQFGDPTTRQGSLNNNSPLRIGAELFTVLNGFFKGILDEVELFNRVLTPEEVQGIYNAGSAGKCKPNNQGGSVSGNVWHDLNHNGVKDSTEVGLAQWPVLLNGPNIAQTETDEDGNYVFTDLKPGDYTISVVYQNNWSSTYPFGGRYPIKLEEAQVNGALHFGFANDPCPTGLKTWSPLGSGINSWVLCLAVKGQDLYAGGHFVTAGNNQTVNNIAKWNGSSWSPLVGINGALGVNGQVNAMVVNGNEIYIGGLFNSAGGVSVKNIAKWDGINWSDIGGGVNGMVTALKVVGNQLYVGGKFNLAGNVSAVNIAMWDGSWHAVGNGVGTGSYELVRALEAIGTDLYVGGKFIVAGSSNVNNIAKWNITNSNWSALGGGVNDEVSALTASGTDLYVGGNFNIADGITVNGITKWDGFNWSPLGGGVYTPSFGASSYVRSIAVSVNDIVYVGGGFQYAGGITVNSIAKYDGTSWSALGSGMSAPSGLIRGIVDAIKIIGPDLYAGGAFPAAGNVSANNIARYSCSGTTTSVDENNSSNIIPQQFQLSQNYPNPFNPKTNIRFSLPKSGIVKITIYNILGQEIKVLVNEYKNPGVYEVKFDARNLASGVYFYTIKAADYYQSKKMILLK